MKRFAKKRAWLFAGLRGLLAITIAFFICQIELHYFESLFYDLRMRMRPNPDISGQIVLIKIDDKTQEILKRLPEARDHEELFRTLEKVNARKVVSTHDLGQIMGSYEELERMAEATKFIPFIALDDTRLPQTGQDDEFMLLPPMQDIKVLSGPKTTDSKNFAKDNVTRRMVIAMEDMPALAHISLAEQIIGPKEAATFHGAFDFRRTTQAYINFRPADSYPAYSFIDVMEGLVSADSLTDKIILIGIDTKAQSTDYVMTPYSRDLLGMSRLELHANILETLILNNAPIQVPHWINILLTCLIAVFTVFVVLTLRPARGLLILLLSMTSYSTIAWALLVIGGVWIDVAHPFLSIFICYYFFIPYRLIMENRRSWEYYQRNTLLTQVEELKSNFLRMMSHDLKTPLARIQGMADVAIRDVNTLSNQQMDAIKTIGKSSEELSQFVGSILNLSRIESKEIKLQLKSKDINALLNGVIEQLQYLATQKNIKIVCEFEPMFSFRIDEDLMRQVFLNLIENAIKYSPENTSILISAEEIEGRIVVQVADQGMGIEQNEINQLFTKFYRSRDVRDGDIKGSGLGLYLSRYFVDLHNGKITVESEKNKGSTFTVELPMDL